MAQGQKKSYIIFKQNCLPCAKEENKTNYFMVAECTKTIKIVNYFFEYKLLYIGLSPYTHMQTETVFIRYVHSQQIKLPFLHPSR